jgi:acyl-coenzyme A synthetase/AMP-(fatty) acid ligase
MNVLDSISRQARAYPDRPALVSGGKTLTYRRLWLNAARTAHHLREQGVRQGERVAVSRMGPQAHLVIVIALARLGAVSTVVQHGWPDDKRAQLFLRNGVTAWVRDQDDLRPLDGVPGLRAIAAQSLFTALAQETAPPPLAQDLADQPWRISLSSGTTGDAKSIPWTHGQVSALHRVSLDVYPAGPGERLLVFADLGIGLGMGHAMMQLAGGGTVILSDSNQAADFFSIVERDKPTRALTTTAIAFTLLEHAKTTRQEPLPLLSLLLGGSAVPPALRQGLEEKVCANLMVTYGSTETGTLARADIHSILNHPDSAGRVMPWVQAEAVDDQDRPLPPGEPGQLRFKSAAMATHYLGNPEATAQTFKSGWYYPGDIGSVDSEGNLMLGGRRDQLLNLQGVKVNPARVEEALNTHPAVVESAVAAITQANGRQRLAAVVVSSGEIDTRQLRELVREKLGRFSVPAFVVLAKALPKNEGGKVMRDELVALIERSIEAAQQNAASDLPEIP